MGITKAYFYSQISVSEQQNDLLIRTISSSEQILIVSSDPQIKASHPQNNVMLFNILHAFIYIYIYDQHST